MNGDKVQPMWSRFWRSAYPLLSTDTMGIDELRRLELAARYWQANIKSALDRREARYGRKRA